MSHVAGVARVARTARGAGYEGADPRWQSMYKVGGIACIGSLILIALAIVAYFIWPYQPGFTSTEGVFANLQTNRLGGLIALDIFMFVTEPVMLLVVVALYIALRQVDEPWALIALILGLIALVALIPSRPIAEVVYLSDRYAAATTEAARSQYLAAGEALLPFFNGTGWIIWTVLTCVSTLVYALLMLRSRIFSRATAWLGIALFVPAMAVFIPVVGPILSLLATVGGIAWYVLMARDFFRLSRSAAQERESAL